MLSQSDIKRRGMMFVLSSPSGAGKTTLSRMMKERDGNLFTSVSVTTRPKRPGEEHGRDYYFVSREEFGQMAIDGDLLEHAKVFGNYYGTPRGPIERSLAEGKDIIFDVDWQGTRQLSRNARNDLVSIFILPPSLEELERRLRTRGRDTEEEIVKRMAEAAEEISHWDEYDYVVVNHNLEKSLERVMAILTAERLKRTRQDGLPDFVKALCKIS